MIYKSKTIAKLIIPQNFRSRLMEISWECSDREVSGLLIGDRIQHKLICSDIHYADSKQWRNSSFEIYKSELTEYLAPHNRLTEKVVGIFHTHPGGTRSPSFDDIKGMIKTAVPWVILRPQDIRFITNAYIFEEGVVRTVPIST